MPAEPEVFQRGVKKLAANQCTSCFSTQCLPLHASAHSACHFMFQHTVLLYRPAHSACHFMFQHTVLLYRPLHAVVKIQHASAASRCPRSKTLTNKTHRQGILPHKYTKKNHQKHLFHKQNTTKSFLPCAASITSGHGQKGGYPGDHLLRNL